MHSRCTGALLALCLLIAGFVPESAGAGTEPPRPLADQPSPSYPPLAGGVEGAVRFRLTVLTDGRTSDIRILSVPVEGVGFEQAAIEALGKWRFTPATRDDEPFESPFAGKLGFVAPEYQRGGFAFDVSSVDAWQALLEVCSELGLQTKTKREKHGVLVTKARKIGDWLPEMDSLETRGGMEYVDVSLHAFVPQPYSPARIYLNTQLATRGSGTLRGTSYNSGHLERLVFDRIAEKLNLRGHPIPLDPGQRWSLFSELDPSAARCARDDALLAGAPGAGPVPKLVFKSEIVFPLERNRHVEGRAILQGIVFEDGSLGDLSVINTRASEAHSAAAKGGASLWRYSPAIVDDCPTSVHYTILMTFSYD